MSRTHANERSRYEPSTGTLRMRRMLLMTSTIAAAALCAIARPAAAELIEKSGRFGGLNLTYKVLLPPGYDAAREYPAVLVFTGGPQRLDMAENTINTDWRTEAESRGYTVISPGSPDGSLFFEAADRVFPELLDTILADYNVAGRKLAHRGAFERRLERIPCCG